MDIQKLDKWADLLLDTGKRNSLINFRDTKASTVEILAPAPRVLFEKIESSTIFEVFDPKIIDDEDDWDGCLFNEQQIEDSILHDEKANYLTQYSGKLRRQNQILVYNAAANPIVAIKNISKKAREFIDETGVNVAYIAVGFIHWKESESSNYVYRAPILLVPIQLEQTSLIDPCV